jgi:tRNA(fMet)-specific endonuclease VapC
MHEPDAGSSGPVVTGKTALRYGAAKKGSAVLQQRVEQLPKAIPVLPLAPDADRFYGDIRTALETAGKIIDGNDLLIAAHALATDAVLVTDNTREFQRVTGLKIENWLRP